MSKIQYSCFLYGIAYLYMSCNPVYQTSSVEHQGYSVMNMRVDSTVQKFLQSYKDSMTASMSAVLATLETDLEKQQPESTLGNFMADAVYTMAQKKYGITPDAAFINYGGIRLPAIKAGIITRGKIYELFPFDNVLVLVKIKGNVLQQFLDHISNRGGWPVSGMKMQIQNPPAGQTGKKAVNILIGGSKIDMDKEYIIALGDYTANGGDDAFMLRGLPQINNGYLMRDALIDYSALVKKINVQLENRVSHVD